MGRHVAHRSESKAAEIRAGLTVRLSLAQEDLSLLRDLIAGRFSRDFLTQRLTPLLVASFVSGLLISFLLCEGYEWTKMDLSRLGVYTSTGNLIGPVVWSATMVLTGLLLIPIISFLRGNLKNCSRRGLNIGTFFFYLCTYGLVGLGTVPLIQGNRRLYFIHVFHASLCFGGAYIGFWSLFLSMRGDLDNRKQAMIGSIITCAVIAGFVVSQVVRISLNIGLREIWYLSISAWEWLIIAVMFTTYIFIFLGSEISVADHSKGGDGGRSSILRV